jgi:hypothetical protein
VFVFIGVVVLCRCVVVSLCDDCGCYALLGDSHVDVFYFLWLRVCVCVCVIGVLWVFLVTIVYCVFVRDCVFVRAWYVVCFFLSCCCNSHFVNQKYFLLAGLSFIFFCCFRGRSGK